MGPAIALGLPHTPWIPERVESFDRLRQGLAANSYDRICANMRTREFTDRESNRIWPTKLWTWACSTGATHLLQLQDDVIPGPNFWPALHAMLEAIPDQIIGLEAAHPLGPEMLRTGRRWYRTRAWLIGVQYAWPLDPALPHGLPAFLKWCAANPERVASTNEDSLISQWAYEHGFDIWHPVPAIADHDLGVPSTYGNDTHHEFSMFRRPTVTWRDVPSITALEDPTYWRCTAESAPLLPGPGTQRCWYCLEEQGPLIAPVTGARIGRQCLARILETVLGRLPA